MNTVISYPTAATVKTTAPSLTAAETKEFARIKSELARLDNLLGEVANLKETLATVGRDFASGKVDVLTAAAILVTTVDERAAMQQGLRTAVKLSIRAMLDEAQGLVDKARQHAVEDLAERCRIMEKAERDNAANVGIGADDYRASGMLESLREQHRQARELIGTPVQPADLANL